MAGSDRALEYVERSKARNLVELLAARDLYPRGNVPQTVIEELDRLRREIVTEQRRIEMRSGVGEIANLETLPALAAFQDSRTYLNQLQQELEELIRQDIQPYDSTFSLTQRVEPVTFKQMRDLLPNSQTALIEWYIAEETFLAFIVAPHSQTPFVWQSSTQDYQALMAWISSYLTTYYDNKQQWQSTLNEQLQQLATILHLDYLLSVLPSDCSQLILIPHRFLHLFPLHALPVGEGRSPLASGTQPSDTLCLLDKFPGGVRYAGSPSVVSSLWTISDISTALLAAKFYQNLQQGSSVAVALNQAQRWLRDATGDELQQWMEEQQLPLNPTLKISLQRRFRQNRQPFQSPFYWAAFCAVGQ